MAWCYTTGTACGTETHDSAVASLASG